MSQDVEPTEAQTAPTSGAASKANETLEDYTLRFAPRSYRKWGVGVVAISALGGIAYLADFAIGANIGISYGTVNALWGILVFAVVIFLSGFPLAYYAARYNLDLDLITRGSGFGYYGSVVTNVIFATFTFIFFALEGSIMAQGLQLGLGIPLWIGYAVSTVIIFPLVIYGMKVLSKLQLWTTPLWLILMVAAVRLPAHQPPGLGHARSSPTRARRAHGFAEPRVDLARRGRLPLAHRPDRRADRLPAVHAPAHPGELAHAGGPRRSSPARAGSSSAPIKQVDRPVPRRLPHRERRRRRGLRQPAGAAVPGDLHEHHAAWLALTLAVDPRRDQPDQDQRHQRLLRLAGVDELLHPRHQALPGPAGVPRRQPRDRADPDGSEHVRLPQHDPRVLRELRHGVGRRRRLRHRVQQVPARSSRRSSRSSAAACSTRSTRSGSARC